MKRHIPYGLVLIGIVAFWVIFLVRLDKWDLEFVGVVLVFSAFIAIFFLITLVQYIKKIRRGENNFLNWFLLVSSISLVLFLAPPWSLGLDRAIARSITKTFHALSDAQISYVELSLLYLLFSVISILLLSFGVPLILKTRKKVFGTLLVLTAVIGVIYPYIDQYLN